MTFKYEQSFINSCHLFAQNCVFIKIFLEHRFCLYFSIVQFFPKTFSNSALKISVVSVSKFVRRTKLRLKLSLEHFTDLTNRASDLKKTSAQRSFGNPKMPDEIAGIDKLIQSSLLAQWRVLKMALDSWSTYSLAFLSSCQIGPTA